MMDSQLLLVKTSFLEGGYWLGHPSQNILSPPFLFPTPNFKITVPKFTAFSETLHIYGLGVKRKTDLIDQEMFN